MVGYSNKNKSAGTDRMSGVTLFLRYYTISLRFQNHFTLKQLDILTVSMENVHLMHSRVSHLSQDFLLRIFQTAGRGCNSKMVVLNKQLDLFEKDPSTRPLR